MCHYIEVVHSVGELATIMKRDGSETNKRSIILRDDSGASVELTLWAPQANEVGRRGWTHRVDTSGRHIGWTHRVDTSDTSG